MKQKVQTELQFLLQRCIKHAAGYPQLRYAETSFASVPIAALKQSITSALHSSQQCAAGSERCNHTRCF